MSVAVRMLRELEGFDRGRYAGPVGWVGANGDGEWAVVFETRCRHLEGSLLCAVYPERPIICRDFDNTTCDVNDPVGGLALATPEEFLAALEQTGNAPVFNQEIPAAGVYSLRRIDYVAISDYEFHVLL